ncbi:MAG: hypothetical protein LBI73_07025 [Myroides sp.]|jgi:hypothetical protein|nr:hypothetical protein [Myroides sp.]
MGENNIRLDFKVSNVMLAFMYNIFVISFFYCFVIYMSQEISILWLIVLFFLVGILVHPVLNKPCVVVIDGIDDKLKGIEIGSKILDRTEITSLKLMKSLLELIGGNVVSKYIIINGVLYSITLPPTRKRESTDKQERIVSQQARAEQIKIQFDMLQKGIAKFLLDE